jgi:hypothetical protein
MTAVMRHKTVSLTFRGFELSPCQIEEMLGVKASETGQRGAHVKPGVKAVLKRSFVRFAIELDSSSRLDQVVPALLHHVGGVERIKKVRDAVMPEFFELDIIWPVKSSDEQEGGFLPPSVLSDLSRLECALTFGFI